MTDGSGGIIARCGGGVRRPSSPSSSRGESFGRSISPPAPAPDDDGDDDDDDDNDDDAGSSDRGDVVVVVNPAPPAAAVVVVAVAGDAGTIRTIVARCGDGGGDGDGVSIDDDDDGEDDDRGGAPPPIGGGGGGGADGAVTTGTGNNYVSPRDFELLKVIGMGAFGKVRRGLFLPVFFFPSRFSGGIFPTDGCTPTRPVSIFECRISHPHPPTTRTRPPTKQKRSCKCAIVIPPRGYTR